MLRGRGRESDDVGDEDGVRGGPCSTKLSAGSLRNSRNSWQSWRSMLAAFVTTLYQEYVHWRKFIHPLRTVGVQHNHYGLSR